MDGLHAIVCILAIAVFTPNVLCVVVQTEWGPVRGYKTDTAQVFHSIPYASPPVGDLRFRPPQPPKPWHPNVIDATQLAPGCPQDHCGELTPKVTCPTNYSEDCLYLSIYAPANAKNDSNLPVMFFIHGGNFFYGAGSSPLYNGTAIAQKGNVVVVDVNYRIGALGYLVTGKGPNDATGNYGQLDQRWAMQWVNKNIRSFGGDPHKVTIFGQSAGAQSAAYHLLAEASSPYFRSAIIESDPFGIPYKTYNEAFILGGLFAEQVGCSVGDLQCMRGVSAEVAAKAAYRTRAEVASVQFLEQFEPYGPYIDGVDVKGQPVNLFPPSAKLSKPLMLGTTSEETVVFVYGAYNKSVSLAEYFTLYGAIRPSKILDIVEKYPPIPASNDQREMLVKAATDLLFTCATRNVSQATVQNGYGDVWVYLWDHAFSFAGGWGHVTFCEGRVCHGCELPYLFDTVTSANFTFTADEVVLSDNIIKYWTNFAWTGNPNNQHDSTEEPCVLEDLEDNSKPDKSRVGGKIFNVDSPKKVPNLGDVIDGSLLFKSETKNSKVKCNNNAGTTSTTPKSTTPVPLPVWPRYEAKAGWPSMHFKTPRISTVNDYRKEYCDFWDSLGYIIEP